MSVLEVKGERPNRREINLSVTLQMNSQGDTVSWLLNITYDVHWCIQVEEVML